MATEYHTYSLIQSERLIILSYEIDESFLCCKKMLNLTHAYLPFLREKTVLKIRISLKMLLRKIALHDTISWQSSKNRKEQQQDEWISQ